MKVKIDATRRYTSVQEGNLLCNRLQLRDKLIFETSDTWGALFKTKTHKRKLQTIEKIENWMQWYIPKKLNCEDWYCSPREQSRILNKYKEWKYTILYIVNSTDKLEEKGDE